MASPTTLCSHGIHDIGRGGVNAPAIGPLAEGQAACREHCFREAGRVLLNVAIRIELERRAAEVATAG